MDQIYYHFSSLLRSMDLDKMYDELQKMRMPFQVHYTDGSLSWFLRPDKVADAVLWQNHLLTLRDKTCDWDEAQNYCQENKINGTPCRMMTFQEFQMFTPKDIRALNELFLKLGGMPLKGTYWGSDVYPGERGDLACIKNIDTVGFPQWSYKKYDCFYKVRPIL